MNIPKAIEVLQNLDASLPQFRPGTRRQAIRLGIEVLRWYQEQRKRRGATKTMWLPGETEE